MHSGLPTIQRFTFLSSPPVTSVRPFVGLRARQLTVGLCASYRSPAAGLILIDAHPRVQLSRADGALAAQL